MDTLEKIVVMSQWFILPLTYFVLLVLFLLFVVRPFFANLFNIDRIKAVKAQKEARLAVEMARKAKKTENPYGMSGDDSILYPQKNGKEGIKTHQEAVSRFDEVDPEKAGELVKQWIKKDPR